jgi:hypothetical protein
MRGGLNREGGPLLAALAPWLDGAGALTDSALLGACEASVPFLLDTASGDGFSVLVLGGGNDGTLSRTISGCITLLSVGEPIGEGMSSGLQFIIGDGEYASRGPIPGPNPYGDGEPPMSSALIPLRLLPMGEHKPPALHAIKA